MRSPPINYESIRHHAHERAILATPTRDADRIHARDGAHHRPALSLAAPGEAAELVRPRDVRLPDRQEVLRSELRRAVHAHINVAHRAIGEHELDLRPVLLHEPEATGFAGARRLGEDFEDIVRRRRAAEAAARELLRGEGAADVGTHGTDRPPKRRRQRDIVTCHQHGRHAGGPPAIWMAFHASASPMPGRTFE